MKVRHWGFAARVLDLWAGGVAAANIWDFPAHRGCSDCEFERARDSEQPEESAGWRRASAETHWVWRT